MFLKKSNTNKVSITIYNSSGCSIRIEEDRDILLSSNMESFYNGIYNLVKNNEGVNEICESSDKLYTDICIYSLEK